jgi:hypothetical protein
MGNKKPQLEKQAIQWPKERGQKTKKDRQKMLINLKIE